MTPSILKVNLRGLLATLWPLLAAVAALLLMATLSMEIMSSVRSYVTGESLWSKGQKDAIFYLLEYARNHDEATFAAVSKSLALPMGDRLARETLSSQAPDLRVARDGFLQGGNHPDDVPGMIRLFLFFGRVSFMAEAIDTWREGDQSVIQLQAVADELHARVRAGDQAAIAALVERVDTIDAQVTPLEEHFSATLGQAARATQRLLMLLMFAASMLLVPLGVVLVARLVVARDLATLEKVSLEQEMQIAARIQQLVLPETFDIPQLDIAAAMTPVASVGGDYYDVLKTPDGAWFGVGDVAGHGLTSGLVMLMAQSTLAGIVAAQPRIAPREALQAMNAVLYDNIRKRMKKDEHVTLVLLRYFHDGRFVFTGAHEDLIIWRAQSRKCELIATPGTWLGGMADVAPFTTETELQLMPGDLLVLYTDGVLEARNRQKQQYGVERLCALIEAGGELSPSALRDRIMASVKEWTLEQRDDVSTLVVRYRPGSGS